MRLPRPAVKVSVFAVLIACAFGLGALRARAVDREDGSAVAFVDTTPISRDDVEVRLAEILPSASYHGQLDPGRLLSLRRAALDDLVLDELIYREALAAGRQPATAEVDQALAAVKGRFDTIAEFERALRENGITEAALRSRLAKTVMVRTVRAAREEAVVGDAEVSRYYTQHLDRFRRPEQVHLLEILVRADPADPASAPTAERKARRILARLQAGENFGSLARTFSEDEYRVKDGDMGFVHRGRLDAAFDAAVFDAPVGRLSIAPSLYGCQVFVVIDRRPSTQLSLDEARPIVAEALQRQQREEGVKAWHARLLASAHVDIRDPALRGARPAAMPDATRSMASRLRTAAPARDAE